MNWRQWYEEYRSKNSVSKKVLGVVLILLGFFALITPFTPGSWLAFVGLELLGVHLAIWERFKKYLKL